MSNSESFRVTAIIEKLSIFWKDFKNYLKHKHKDINLEELLIPQLRIEEDNRNSEKEKPKIIS